MATILGFKQYRKPIDCIFCEEYPIWKFKSATLMNSN